MGYFRAAAKGVGWVGGFRVFTRGISFIRTIILARILAPSQFGIYAIATIVLSFLEIITETGINVVLVQEDEENVDDYISTAWVVSIIRGFLIGGLIFFTAPFVSEFFSSDAVLPLLQMISLVALVRGFINPSIAKLQKELRFGKDFALHTSVFVFDSFVSVAATLILASPIGIIYGLLAGALLEVALSWLMLRPLPKFTFDKMKLKAVFGRGKWITMSGIFNYFISQGDDAVVGKILGSSSLGIYQVAYKLSTLPLTEVAQVFTKVTFPVFVKISSDKPRLKRAFVKTFFTVSGLSLIFSFMLFSTADFLVPFVLGLQWREAVPILKVLAIFGFLRAVIVAPFSLFVSLKKQKYVTSVLLVELATLALLIIPFIRLFGLLGAGYATIIAAIFPLPLLGYLTYLCLRKSKARE